jgi:hypothetical protein
MTKTELKELMEYLSAIDNRQLTAEKLQVWFDLVGYLDFDDAKAAVIEAQRDPSLGYVEAKHVIANALRIKDRRKTEEHRSRATSFTEERKGDPHPICAHGKRLLTCDPCCRNAAIQAGLIKAN